MCTVQTGGKSIGGNMIVRGGKNDQRKYVRVEGICPGCQNDGREYVQEGICPYPAQIEL